MENQDYQNQAPNHSKTLPQKYKEALLKSGIQATNLLTELIELKIMPDPRAKKMADVALEVIKLINSGSEEIVKIYENLSSNLTDTQTPVTSPSPPQELTLNPEHQTTIRNPVSVQLETISDILSLLTREEIAQFHRAIQLESTYQIKVGQTILAQLQTGLQTRLGELAEQVFDRTYQLLKAGNLDSKSLKFIQRYAEIAAQTRGLKEEGKKSNLSREITELSEISSIVESRLSQLTKNGLSGKEEIEMLIEIEELKRQLTDRENLLKS